MRDHYRTLNGRAEHRLKVERSEFLGIAFPISDEEAFFAELDRMSREHFDATHHCWAFRLFEGERARSSDAGEPSGTAGRPILSAIEGANLYDAAVIVVRWFGGVKLGTGGLGRAYRDCAAATLRDAPVVERFVYQRVTIIVPFDALGTVYRLVSPPDVLLAGERFGERNEFDFDVRQSLLQRFTDTLREKRIPTLP